MTNERTFQGMPIITATPAQLKTAVMLGKFLHRAEGMAFYEYEGKIFVVESGKPRHGQSESSAAVVSPATGAPDTSRPR